MSSPRVVIVGGGVAGLSVAWSLRRRGADVSVLDRGRIGAAASSANAGWICPAQSAPLPEPGLATHGLQSALHRDAPLYLAPAHLPRLLPWLARFALRCNARHHRRGVEALGTLARRVFELTDQLAADGIAVAPHRRGMLLAAERREVADAFLRGLQPLRALGYEIPSRLLDGAEMREREPGLAPRVAAGFALDQHWHVDPPAFMQALADGVRAMGVRLEEGEEVIALGGGDGRVRTVRTAGGEREADAVVLAAGAWSPRLARGRALRLPIEAGKGYSVEVELSSPPERALMLLDAHVVCTPLGGGRVRIGGTMEFSGVNERIDERRVASIVRGAARMLPEVGDAPRLGVWGGMRPIAPDGLPVIGRAPRHENLYVASAYSMLGMTVAAPAGEALAELILDGRRAPELEPFRADRFRW